MYAKLTGSDMLLLFYSFLSISQISYSIFLPLLLSCLSHSVVVMKCFDFFIFLVCRGFNLHFPHYQ